MAGAVVCEIGYLNVTIAGLVADEQSQLINGNAGKRTPLNADALGNSRNVEEELVCGSRHKSKRNHEKQ
jgi:hypothetical protein